MKRWGRLLLVGGFAGTILGLAPMLLLTWLAPSYAGGFVGALAVLMMLSVAPLAALTAAVGLVLMLIAFVRRDPR